MESQHHTRWMWFQSTLPRGERRFFSSSTVPSCNFNPRSHEGSDQKESEVSHDGEYFNPRSHEGSDLETRDVTSVSCISIHAPTRGATLTCCILNTNYYISIHAPTRGATKKSRCKSELCRFQSTLPRGERPIMSGSNSSTLNFNPRSHEGSDSNFRQKVLFSLSKNCLKYLILTTNYFN